MRNPSETYRVREGRDSAQPVVQDWDDGQGDLRNHGAEVNSGITKNALLQPSRVGSSTRNDGQETVRISRVSTLTC